MRFPPDLKISAEAKNLILSLCTGSKDRIGYDGIGCHRYFNGIEWEKLQTSKYKVKPSKRPNSLVSSRLLSFK